ncbi:hypothetical protein WJX82_005897 [Trebouxia sp. C0006]
MIQLPSEMIPADEPLRARAHCLHRQRIRVLRAKYCYMVLLHMDRQIWVQVPEQRLDSQSTAGCVVKSCPDTLTSSKQIFSM